MHRLGGTRRLPVDIRVIAATNQDLPRRSPKARSARTCTTASTSSAAPAAAARAPRGHAARSSRTTSSELHRADRRAVRLHRPRRCSALYDWPGNVRELRNVVERRYAELPSAPVRFLDMPSTLRDRVLDTPPILHTERDRLVAVLTQTNWNKSRAAEQLQWSRMTLYRKLAKYALREPA